MATDWTLDANVLYRAADVDLEALELLGRIKREGHLVAFDFGREIQGQYERCFRRCCKERRPGIEAVQKWFKYIIGTAAFTTDGALSKKHRTALSTRLCSEKDWVFVAVLSRTESKRLVTQDLSDFNSNVCSYLRAELAVAVLQTKEALVT